MTAESGLPCSVRARTAVSNPASWLALRRPEPPVVLEETTRSFRRSAVPSSRQADDQASAADHGQSRRPSTGELPHEIHDASGGSAYRLTHISAPILAVSGRRLSLSQYGS